MTFTRPVVQSADHEEGKLIFLARGELSAWLGNQDVRRQQWKVCNRFWIVSNSAGDFMHSLNGR